MNKDDEKILEIFRETGALMEGHFILRSGLHSGHFFQCARVCERMDRVEELVGMLVKKLDGLDCATVLSPAMGGLVLGQELARQLKKRFIFAEKQDGNLVLRRNFKIAPHASLSDGQLDMVEVLSASKWKLALAAPTFFSKTFRPIQVTRTQHTARAVIHFDGEIVYHLDGEPKTAQNELHISLLPKALRLLVPDRY